MIIPLTIVLVLVSFALHFMTPEMIEKYLSKGNQVIGVILASILGSVTMMPGFIAFPLSGILKDNNVSYMIISAFTTTLMMVGVLTFPVEQNFLGTKVSIIRNTAGFIMALIVALITGLVFGEIL
ncbi:MAG: permease [Spirochaetales bacterium]|uniref:Permease n=1 Tax=Candidatus Thalassospirochaeta sargassi TaxID=3119039 RepID=A0AAJ1IBU4_9SPIO|nr:permease [Spirochaetales bacterium]